MIQGSRGDDLLVTCHMRLLTAPLLVIIAGAIIVYNAVVAGIEGSPFHGGTYAVHAYKNAL